MRKTGLLRKDLKIRGQVGEADKKDTLSYISLIHQINIAQQAGFQESEIVQTLRNVLEKINNLFLV